jgi:methylglutamate dehydrogenase subunit B
MNAARVLRPIGTDKMLINCPHCGERDLQEFIYAGAADVKRPSEDASSEIWNEFIHLRKNPRGPTLEYWQHVFGCRSILIVERNTQTHEIMSVKFARDEGANE